jgi:hypothetical protein
LWPPPRRRTGRWSDEFPWRHRRLTIFDQPNMGIWWWFRWFDGDFMVFWILIGISLDSYWIVYNIFIRLYQTTQIQRVFLKMEDPKNHGFQY